MRIRREYSQPFYGSRRSIGNGAGRLIFLIIASLIVIGLLFLATSPKLFSQARVGVLEMVGQAPPPTPYAADWAERGTQAYYAGNLEQAAEYFQNAIDQQPENINYLFEYGRILVELDRTDDAVAIGDQMRQLVPDDPRGYDISSRALMWTDPTAAIPIAINGQEVDPAYAPLYAVLGVAYTNLGRWQEGTRMGRQAVELDPNDAFVQRSLYWPLQYVGDWDGAISALETAIELNPNLVSAYYELAGMYKLPQVNRPREAIALYLQILQRQPDDAKAYLRLCETYAGVEYAQFDVAQDYCEQALEIDPEYGSAYRELGRMQYNRRNYEGAIESFQECVDLGATDIECWYLRGLAHYWLGDCQQAWDILQDSALRAQELGSGEAVMEQITLGLGGIQANCTGFSQRTVPTLPPATAIPPTPIGGFG